MNGFWISTAVLLVVVIPIAIILMKIIFKKSVFWQIGSIWVATVLFTSINNSARIQFDSYSQGLALPIGIIVIGFGIYISSRFVKQPLNNMIQDLTKLSQGDINIEIADKFSNRNDEIGMLAKVINSLGLSLNTMINEIRNNSSELNKISRELNQIMRSLINNTSSQSSSIEEISATMEEMTTQNELKKFLQKP